jgi:hypothetical protein
MPDLVGLAGSRRRRWRQRVRHRASQGRRPNPARCPRHSGLSEQSEAAAPRESLPEARRYDRRSSHAGGTPWPSSRPALCRRSATPPPRSARGPVALHDPAVIERTTPRWSRWSGDGQLAPHPRRRDGGIPARVLPAGRGGRREWFEAEASHKLWWPGAGVEAPTLRCTAGGRLSRPTPKRRGPPAGQTRLHEHRQRSAPAAKTGRAARAQPRRDPRRAAREHARPIRRGVSGRAGGGAHQLPARSAGASWRASRSKTFPVNLGALRQ